MSSEQDDVKDKINVVFPLVTQELSCIEIIAPKAENWAIQIGTTKLNLDYLFKDEVWNRKPAHPASITFGNDKPTLPHHLECQDYFTFYKTIDTEPLQCFYYMKEECLKNENLLRGLAWHLSGKSIETICKHIFQSQNLEEKFLDIFFKIFFPEYLKRSYNWFSLDLLIRASIAYPEKFTLLVVELLRDLKVKSDILYDFVSTLDSEKKTSVLLIITRVNLTNKQFCHHLKTLHSLFIDCERNDNIFNYIAIHLEFHANFCSYNKDYGRLLLAFMSNLSSFNIAYRTLKKLIDSHGSPYKGACISVLNDIVGELIHLQYNLQVPHPRFVVPREREPLLL